MPREKLFIIIRVLKDEWKTKATKFGVEAIS
jgi:hypothetical protein